MKNKTVNVSIVALLFGIILSSCNYLDIKPVGQVIPGKSSEYRALINSAYSLFPRHKAYLNMRGNHYNPEDDPFGFGMDGFDMYKAIYTWDDSNSDIKTQEFPYIAFYQVIFMTNEIINNGPNASVNGSESMKQIIGEAYALRAYAYFELVNIYAPVYNKSATNSVKAVPLTTEIDIAQTFPKATLQAVYDLIMGDLEKAQTNMEVTRQENENKYRFSMEALHALQSRVFLYMQDWQKSVDASKKVLAINKELEDMNSDKYVANTNYKSKEVIASFEELTTMELRDYTSISNSLLNLYVTGDIRPSHYFSEHWMGYSIVKKLTNINEHVSFRRAEIYLNAAEALARLGSDGEARQYMADLMKNRYTPTAYTTQIQHINALSGEALVNEILLERERELALEGHQWYDWRRTGQPEVKKMVKGTEYILKKNDPRYTLQIPKSAREANPLLNE
ncbi:MAG: RagB/SusD family nutrient uptake outer membrane protein [Bacteroidia bacterium]|nr:RagB/SusD family nutrient uptake outer membrane protein [Bacteroidia bacterium]